MIKISKLRTQITFHKVVREPVTNQYNLVLAKRRWYSQAGKVTADLAAYGRFITNSPTCSLLRDHDQLCHQRLHGEQAPIPLPVWSKQQFGRVMFKFVRSIPHSDTRTVCQQVNHDSRSQYRATKQCRYAQTVALWKWLIFCSDSDQHVDSGSLFHFLHHCRTEDFKRLLIISHSHWLIFTKLGDTDEAISP